MTAKYSSMFKGRKLAEGYPGLEEIASAHYSSTPMGVHEGAQTMIGLERLVALPSGPKRVAVVGSGPRPDTLTMLRDMGYQAVGIEPDKSFVRSARAFLEGEEQVTVLEGAAESLPIEDESVSVVLLESVLEHVDSPSKALAEAFRVLRPGGVAFVETSNRPRFHPLGVNGEYNLPFYNYYPRTLKEALVHHHLHFKPTLANYATRPAVHWFSYADLCARGREAGFYRFYPRFDGMDPSDKVVSKGWLRRLFLRKIQFSPIFRALALLQYGGAVYMLKRASD